MEDPSELFAQLRISNNNRTRGDHFQKVRTLGEGAFGCVYLSTVKVKKKYADIGDKVAIKRFTDVSNSEMAIKEGLVLCNLKHEHIVRFLDIYKNSKRQLCLVMEYCNYGTLEDWLSNPETKKPLPEFICWRLIWQFSSVLSYLHSQRPPIQHNDFKPANILCKWNANRDGVGIKIADFGVCNVLG